MVQFAPLPTKVRPNKVEWRGDTYEGLNIK